MKIPIINRNNIPELIASDICSVQPMSGDITKHLFKLKVEESRIPETFGTIVHKFIGGWCIHDGKEFIDFITFIDRHGTEGIKECPKRATICQWYYNQRAGIKF